MVKAAVRVCTEHPGALPDPGQPPQDESGRQPQIRLGVALLFRLRETEREASVKGVRPRPASCLSAHAEDVFPDITIDSIRLTLRMTRNDVCARTVYMFDRDRVHYTCIL